MPVSGCGSACVAGAAALILLAPPIAAAADSQQAANQAPAQLEEIIVTATKRETPLSLTPLSVTALSGDFLDEGNERTFNDYLRQVPGLSAVDGGPGRKTYIIRGINGPQSGASQATVAQYVDEVPITNSFGLQPDPRLVDVERVEVLRGPQGTLFGARSLSGTIRTITRKPVMDRFEGNATVTLSDTHFGGLNENLEAVLNVPLSDTLAARVSGFRAHDEGYVDNIVAGGTYTAPPGPPGPPGSPPPRSITVAPVNQPNYSDVDVSGGRAAVRWDASDRLTIDITGLAQHSDVIPPTYQVQATGNFANGPRTSVIGNVGNRDELFLGTGTVTYDLDFATLTGVGAYSRRDNINTHIAPATGPLTPNGPGSNMNFGGITTSRTFEVRAASKDSGRWDWLVGAYVFHQSQFADAYQYLAFTNTTQMDILSDGISAERAGFGEVSYAVADGLKATAGVRYSSYSQQLNQNFIILPPGAPFALGPYPNPPHADDDGLTPKFSLSYEASPDLFTYVTVSQGFRPGGFNPAGVQGIPGIPPYFKADSLWNYEVGAKTSAFDHRLTVDGALYRMDWTDIQTDTSAPGSGMPMGYTINASAARVVGLELEAHARFTEEFSADLAFNHFFQAELTADAPVTPQGLAAKAHDALPYDPDTTFNLGLDYRHALTATLSAFLHGEWSYTGARTTGFRPALVNGTANNGYNSFAAYSLFNLRAGVRWERWRVTAYADNLGDARPVLQQTNFAPTPVSTRVTTRPRTFGVTVNVGF